MKRSHRPDPSCRVAIGLATGLAWTAAGIDARAHGGMDEDRTSTTEPAGARAAGVADTRPVGESDADGVEHRRATVSLDLVFGWGKVPFAVQNLPTTGEQSLNYSRSDATPADVQSFLLGGTFGAGEHLELGLLVPFTLGTFSPAGSAARSTTSLENVELDGMWRARLGDRLELEARIGLVLPTAQGEEIPASLANAPASSVNPQSYDRFSLARAAAMVRGYEDNALFVPGRLGMVPELSLAYEGARFRFEPYVKVENLMRTDTSLDALYVGELVAAVRAGLRVGSHVELAARGWASVGFAGTPDDRTVAVAVEPDVLGLSGPLKGYAGVVVPLAGPPAQAGFFGVRLGLVFAF